MFSIFENCEIEKNPGYENNELKICAQVKMGNRSSRDEIMEEISKKKIFELLSFVLRVRKHRRVTVLVFEVDRIFYIVEPFFRLIGKN